MKNTELSPEEAKIIVEIETARQHYKKSKYDKTIEVCENFLNRKLIDEHPLKNRDVLLAKVYNLRGLACLEKGTDLGYSEAEWDFKKALELDPHHPEALKNLKAAEAKKADLAKQH